MILQVYYTKHLNQVAKILQVVSHRRELVEVGDELLESFVILFPFCSKSLLYQHHHDFDIREVMLPLQAIQEFPDRWD